MALYCELCGSGTDGAERLGRYCPGEYCGTDLRAGPDAGVRAWCEPPRRFGTAGATVTLDLLVHNEGPRPTGFRLEPVEPLEGRLDFDRRAVEEPLPAGATRRIELRCTLPPVLTGSGPDIASRFGVPGAGAAGQVHGTPHVRVGVALRVVALAARQGAACAAFAVDVPERPGLGGDGRTRDGGRTAQGLDGGPPPAAAPQPAGPAAARRTGGCGALALALLVAVALALVAVVMVLGAGPGAASSHPDTAPPRSADGRPGTPGSTCAGRPCFRLPNPAADAP
ncbi:hypothetical protein [Kitasatospora sp. NPDC015120]|uniref:hypothetical protein n=1 Tax=Kitasatospora sp. NPDC015120 TaxID=3364023 RepID=UPI0036F482B4